MDRIGAPVNDLIHIGRPPPFKHKPFTDRVVSVLPTNGPTAIVSSCCHPEGQFTGVHQTRVIDDGRTSVPPIGEDACRHPSLPTIRYNRKWSHSSCKTSCTPPISQRRGLTGTNHAKLEGLSIEILHLDRKLE